MPNYDNINELMGSQNPQQELLNHTRKLVEKWEPTGLLEGIDEENRKHGMATPVSYTHLTLPTILLV